MRPRLLCTGVRLLLSDASISAIARESRFNLFRSGFTLRVTLSTTYV
jgi:hypothetical protein